MLAGLAVGIAAGAASRYYFGETEGLARFIEYVAQPAGQLFLRLLFMLVIPLVFSALVLGISGLGDLRSLGRIGLKTFLYTVAVSSVAVFLGIFLVNTLQPGRGLPPETQARMLEGAEQRASSIAQAPGQRTGLDLVLAIVPNNPVRAAADGDILAVMFFALMFGIGLCLVRTDASLHLERGIEGLYDVTMRLIQMVIWLAPFGVAALLFTLTAQLGYDILTLLARYVGVVVLALALHMFVVYSLAVSFLGGMSPLRFFRGVQDAMLVAFSTASSNATLPTALTVAQRDLKLPSHVSRFVLTIGATANQNGTALFEGVTVLFLAQFYGVALTLGQQATVVLICIMGGIGTAGVPAGSIPILAMILGVVGIPVEGIGLILGADRLLDMCRTTLNVTGDLAAAVVVSRGEGAEPPPPRA